jgi:hypothetical protein
MREIQLPSVLAHRGYTDESRHLRPRKRHSQIQTRIAPSDVSSQRHLLPALHPLGQAQMGATIYQHLTYKEAQAESLRRLGDLITEKCEDTSIGAKISKNLALPPKPLAKPGELMLDGCHPQIHRERCYEVLQDFEGATATPSSSSISLPETLSFSSVTTQQLYDFVGYLRREGLGDRTLYHRVGEVVTFLRHINRPAGVPLPPITSG